MRRLLPCAGLVLGCALLPGFHCGPADDCSYEGLVYRDGAQFSSSDGCNTCGCSDGKVACTARACLWQWWRTCGDPVCMPDEHRVDPNIPACGAQRVGEACSVSGELCDPDEPCNVRYLCTNRDPTADGCPLAAAR